MEFACFDESGDTGKTGTDYLILGLMCTNQIHAVRRAIQWGIDQMLRHPKTKKWLNDNGGELKFYKFPDKDLLKRILSKLSEIDIDCYCIAVNKKNKPDQKLDKIMGLELLIRHMIVNRGEFPKSIIADTQFINNKKENKFHIFHKKNGSSIKFCICTEDENEKLHNDGFDELNTFRVLHEDSKHKKELQAIDLICGSVFQSFSKKNQGYIALLKGNKLKLTIIEK
ncbi:MAG: DUF3800 domain-containing protein [Candidatus Aenigmatarchaeota archaeon]